MGKIGAEKKESPRRNAGSIAGPIDCSRGGTRLVVVAGKAKELGIEIEEFAVQSREVIRYVLERWNQCP